MEEEDDEEDKRRRRERERGGLPPGDISQCVVRFGYY
jgi:hypothetical protein